jgi:hypothetical protein
MSGALSHSGLLYTELQSPTIVECSCWARFIPTLPGASPWQLVVARSSVLDVYRIGELCNSKSSLAQLQLIASFPLAGSVAAIEKVCLSGQGARAVADIDEIDAVMLSFKDAKVSLVALDPYSHTLRTLAMLNFEEGGIGPGAGLATGKMLYRNPLGLAEHAAGLRVDPYMRCAVIVPYDEEIAVMPFTSKDYDNSGLHDNIVEDNIDTGTITRLQTETAVVEAEQEKRTRTIFGKPYIIEMRDVASAGAEAQGASDSSSFLRGRIPDMCFLDGCRLPTLAVLIERVPVTSKRLATVQHTFTLAALSLDTDQKTTVDWQHDGLPHDSYLTVPLQEPVGGVLVVSPNALLYFNNSHYVGLALNGFSAYSCDVKGRFPLSTNQDIQSNAPLICLALDAARAVELSPQRILFVSRDGCLHLLKIHTGGEDGTSVRGLSLHPQSIRGIHTQHLAFLQAPHEVSTSLGLGKKARAKSMNGHWVYGLLFQSSRSADSTLSLCGVHMDGPVLVQSTGSMPSNLSRKRARVESSVLPEKEESAPGAENSDDDDDDDDDQVSRNSLVAVNDFVLYPIDSLPNVGPIADTTIGRSCLTMLADDDELPLAPPPTELVLASGRDQTGSAVVMHRGLRPNIASHIRLAGIVGLWTLNFLREGSDDDNFVDGLMIMSTLSSTRIFSLGAAIGEFEDSAPTDIVKGARTLAVGTLLGPGAIIDAPDGLMPPGAVISTLFTESSDSSYSCKALASTPHRYSVLTQNQAKAVERIVQITDAGVYVLSSGANPRSSQPPIRRAVQISSGGLGADNTAHVSFVSICDPYILLRLSDGSIRVLAADVSTGHVSLLPLIDASLGDPKRNSLDPIVSCCLFRDFGGVLESSVTGVPFGAQKNRISAVRPQRCFAFIVRRSGTLDVFAIISKRFVSVFSSIGVHLGPHIVSPNEPTSPRQYNSSISSDAVTASVESVAEPCLDEAQSTEKKMPRSFISDICLQTHDKTICLTMVTNRDQVFVYSLHDASPKPPRESSSAGDIDTNQARKGPIADTISTMMSGAEIIKDSRSRKLDLSSSETILQFTRASLSFRFIRLPHSSQVPTGMPDADSFSSETPEEINMVFRKYRTPRLQPFSNVSGWSGVAVLTPTPVFNLFVRGTAAVVPMSVPNVTGASGSGGLPGDHMFESVVTAFSSFHTPSVCANGFVFAHQGFVQFATLPRPQWPTQKSSTLDDGIVQESLVPEPVQMYSFEKIPEQVNGSRGEAVTIAPLVKFCTPLRLATGSAVLAAAGAVSSTPNSTVLSPSGPLINSHITSQTQVAHILPGPAYAPFYKHYLRTNLVHISFLEFASSQFGARMLSEWHRRQTDYAEMAGLDLPCPPTSTQQQCCLLPIYACAIATPRLRSYKADRDVIFSEYEQLGWPDGPYAQVNYGEHVEYGDVPLKKTGTNSVVDHLADAGLSDPLEVDCDHRVAIYSVGSSDSGSNWVLADSYTLQPFEKILCIREIPLHEGATQGGPPRSAVIVGTGFSTFSGEEVRGVAKGRILIFRIIAAEVSNEPGKPLVVLPLKLKMVYAEDLRTAVSNIAPLVVKETWTGFGSNTAFAAAQGVPLAPGIRMARHLVVAAGRRVEVYEWREGKLGMIAIFDSFSWVKDVIVVNDLIFFGDILGCVRLAKWRDDDHQIIECGSDALLRVRLSSIGLVIDDGTLGLVVTDDEGNLLVDVCSPTEQPKMRLKLRADFHVGSVTRRLVRSRMAVPLGTAVSERKRFATFFGTRAGSVSALLPLDEMSFKRLLMLQKIMTYCLPHAAGLNPRLWRLFASSLNPGGSGSRPRAKNFLDGNLLSRYLSLSTHTQRVFAEAIGSSPERILASLRTIAVSSTCF